MNTTYSFRARESGEFPVLPDQIRQRHQHHVSFGATVEPDVAAMLGYDVVLMQARPEFDSDTQAVQPADPQVVNGEWVQGWVVRDLSAAERAAALAQAVVEVVASAERVAKAKRDAVVAHISPAEMASWPIKRAEALAYQDSGLDADAPNLQIEAQARGVSLAVLAAKVLAKAQLLAWLEAGIAGRCGAIQDAAQAAASPSAVRALDVHAGWPV